ncbi:outer membrane beta-barrel protein [Labilibaculum sp.]|uniref:outer membrane beta-barrel protein n=1 Tax=Labilibaculum sp. TaxID=2060723 RepID=UPI00356ACF25
MKRIILFFIGLVCLSYLAKAQFYEDKTWMLGASVGYQHPTGDFGDYAKSGPVFRLNGLRMLSRKVAVGAELGCSLFGQSDIWDVGYASAYDVKYYLFSAQVKASYFFDTWDRDFRPYISGALGYFQYRNVIEFMSVNSSDETKNTLKENKMGLTPILGFLYHLSDNWTFDMNLRYTYILDFSGYITTQDEDGDDYEYYLGFDKIALPEISVGLYYRF